MADRTMIAYISHPDCLKHEMGTRHPERPARLAAIEEQLTSSGLKAELQPHTAPEATREQLELAHNADHIDHVFGQQPGDGLAWLDGDTAMNRHTVRAAKLAAGAACLGVDLVMANDKLRAFCAVRPPGHHAERHRAMGFCFFDNVAIAAYHALQHHGLERIAIVDFDVHHGNGTEQIVSGDQRILFCSTFQHPFYPNSGADSTADNIVNVPLPEGAAGEAFRAAVEQYWLPRLAAFRPELMIISAGFDAHRDDKMAGMNLVEADYQWVTEVLVEQAEASAGGRIVSALEGGYNIEALARSVETHLRAMM